MRKLATLALLGALAVPVTYAAKPDTPAQQEQTKKKHSKKEKKSHKKEETKKQ